MREGRRPARPSRGRAMCALGACGNGFCIVNGVGPRRALRGQGARRAQGDVFDVRNGNGTQDMPRRARRTRPASSSRCTPRATTLPRDARAAGGRAARGVLNLPVGQRMTPKRSSRCCRTSARRRGAMLAARRRRARARLSACARCTFRPQAFAPFGLNCATVGRVRRPPARPGESRRRATTRPTTTARPPQDRGRGRVAPRPARAVLEGGYGRRLLRRRGRRSTSARERPRGRTTARAARRHRCACAFRSCGGDDGDDTLSNAAREQVGHQ